MPTFDIIKENKADITDFRVSSIIGMFDLQNEHITEHFVGNIDIDNIDWNIGIIYGASGTGKSTIANELFKENIIAYFDYKSKSVIDDMPKDKTVKEIVKMFNSVGFSSPPSWLKPYNVLSNGEKMRVDLANSLLSDKDIIAFDEFTSVVNREVAKIGSYAVQKAIRKNNKKFIAISCHYDIIDWLEPDWTFCTDTMKFEICKKKDQKLNVKSINVPSNYGMFLENIII
jgi:ABC-type ATPase with predicted acetyltransferase domain